MRITLLGQRRLGCLAALSGALASPLAAQTASNQSVLQEQLPGARATGATLAVEQISSGTQSAPSASSQAAEARALQRDRLQARRPVEQLTSEAPGTPAPQQLYRGGRTARAPEPLSRPDQGRTGAVARVEGVDRCDPATGAGANERSQSCANVIEERAAEFEGVKPVVLTPEQRLLAEQRQDGRSAEAAARRLAGGGADPNSIED